MAMAIGKEAWTALAVVAATVWIFRVFVRVVWEPLRLRRIMAKQGVHGPPFRPLVGNLLEAEAFRNSQPEVVPFDYSNHSTVAPQFALYRPKYGKRFVYCWGSDVRLAVAEPEFAKQVLLTQYDSFTRPSVEHFFTSEIVGRGVFTHEGPKWAIERRTLDPFFHTTALKGMAQAMMNAASSEVKELERMVKEAGGTLDTDVEPRLHDITGKVITYTAFTGAEFERANQIYHLQAQIATVTMKTLRSIAFWIPGSSLIPTKDKRFLDQCKAKVDSILLEIINDRIRDVKEGRVAAHGIDLLGRMIAAASEGMNPDAIEFNLASVFNNFKLFYFAGQDTVAQVLSFTMFLLARHQDWQEKARAEVMEVNIVEENVDPNAFSRLKVVTMIINEVLRLFNPVVATARVAKKDVYIEDLFIPKGIAIELGNSDMHTDPEYWGKDAGEFNPQRFANGVTNACTHPQAFNPFSIGPKHCIGNNYAYMEMKTVVSIVLRRFRLTLSPNYKHHPTQGLLQQPKFGVSIIFTTL